MNSNKPVSIWGVIEKLAIRNVESWTTDYKTIADCARMEGIYVPSADMLEEMLTRASPSSEPEFGWIFEKIVERGYRFRPR